MFLTKAISGFIWSNHLFRIFSELTLISFKFIQCWTTSYKIAPPHSHSGLLIRVIFFIVFYHLKYKYLDYCISVCLPKVKDKPHEIKMLKTMKDLRIYFTWKQVNLYHRFVDAGGRHWPLGHSQRHFYS